MKSLALGAALTLTVTWASAQSTIVHSHGPVHLDPWQFAPSASIDMNHDGINDFTLSAGLRVCTTDIPVSMCTQSLYIGIPASNAVLNYGTHVANIPYGEWIGIAGPPNTAWSTHSYTYLLTYWSSPRYGTSGINGPIGEQGQGYVGVRFSAADGDHYGWIFVEGQTLVDWAYESRPNQPIRAGAKPVPVPIAHSSIELPGYLRIVADAEMGKAYQVQFKASLLDFSWSNLSFSLPAHSTSISVDLPLTERKGFYRIVEAD